MKKLLVLFITALTLNVSAEGEATKDVFITPGVFLLI